MKKRLAIVLAAGIVAVAGSQLVFADGGKESVPRPKVEAGESAVPEDEPRILTPDREWLEESPDILTPSGSLGKEPQEILAEAPGEPDLEALKKQQEAEERRRKREKEKLENLIENLERKISQNEEKMCMPENLTDHQLLSELDEENSRYRKELDEAYEKWMEY